MAAAGVPLKTPRSILGHVSLAMTADLCTHTLDAQHVEVVSAMQKLHGLTAQRPSRAEKTALTAATERGGAVARRRRARSALSGAIRAAGMARRRLANPALLDIDTAGGDPHLVRLR